MTQHVVPGSSLYECGRPCDALSCLFFSALWGQSNQSILVQETQSAKDIGLTCFKTFRITAATCLQVGPMSLDWLIDPFAKFDHSRSSLSPEVPSDDQQRDALPASTRSRWKQNTLQAPPQVLQRFTGWDGCGLFLTGGLRCVTWNTRGLIGSVFSKQKSREFKLNYFKKLFDTNNILCLQEVHGKDEYLQDIQVLAPRFRFLVHFPENENTGGSAICIHRDILPEEAIVTHLITCQGRDHLVNIQSGRHNVVIVNVHIEPELTLKQLRGRLHLIHPHWPSYPKGVGIILGDFNICDPEEGGFHVWNQTFTDGDPRKIAMFYSFFPHALEIAPLDYTRRDSPAFDRISHDDHCFSPDPFGALAEFVLIFFCEKC